MLGSGTHPPFEEAANLAKRTAALAQDEYEARSAYPRQTDCCIVGGGPAGLVLGLLLAREGMSVTLLEAHTHFDREFRGNTISPSVLEIMGELGLLDRLLELHHAKIPRFTVRSADGTVVFADFRRLRVRYPYVLMLPQARFLEFIAAEARKYPGFRLVMGARVKELIGEDGMVCGVRYRTSDGPHEVRARLTVGADGRFSTIRRLAGLKPVEGSSPMDVFWFDLPRKPDDPECASAVFRFGPGSLLVLMDHSDHWQVGYIIRKGGYGQLGRRGRHQPGDPGRRRRGQRARRPAQVREATISAPGGRAAPTRVADARRAGGAESNPKVGDLRRARLRRDVLSSAPAAVAAARAALAEPPRTVDRLRRLARSRESWIRRYAQAQQELFRFGASNMLTDKEGHRGMKEGKILVVGATGRVGGAAVEEFLRSGFEVRALVRRASKGERPHSLGAEVAVGDVSAPGTLDPAVEGCSGVFSALSAGPGRGDAEEIDYRGNLNLLSAARSAGVGRFVYSSALMADHPLAQKVGPFREKAHFERKLMAAEGVSWTILRPAMFMETLHMMLKGSVAFVPGRQRNPISWISARDIAQAAVRGFQWKIPGCHELAGPDTATFDEAFERFEHGSGKKIRVLHVPLAAMRLTGQAIPYVRELADMMTLFDAAGFATKSRALRDKFGVDALTVEEWAGGGRRTGSDQEELESAFRGRGQ